MVWSAKGRDPVSPRPGPRYEKKTNLEGAEVVPEAILAASDLQQSKDE